jgi:fumarate hydratase class II
MLRALIKQPLVSAQATRAFSHVENGSPWTRIERDSLGSVEVPMDAKWKAQTQRATNDFPVSGYKMPKSFLKSLALVKYCAAKANAKANCLDSKYADAISEVALQIYQGEYLEDAFPVDIFQTGSGSSTNMNMNEVISQLVSENYSLQVHPNDHVNRSQSSNDVVPTTLSISAVVDIYMKLLPVLRDLMNVLDGKAVEYSTIYKNSRTHLMDAVPMTLGHEFSTWSIQLQSVYDMLLQATAHCEVIPIGGTAIGTGINTPAHYTEYFLHALNTQLGTSFISLENKSTLISGVERMVHLSAALRTLSTCLFKITTDLRWMNSGPLSGLGEITVPKMQPGSNIIPGKVNPVILESLAMVTVHVMGTDQIISTAAATGSNFQLHTMFPLIAYHLLENIRLLSNGCEMFQQKVLTGLVVHREHLQACVAANSMIIAALTPVLGYQRCAILYAMCREEKKSLQEVLMRELGLSLEEVNRMLQTALKSFPSTTNKA